MIIKYGVTKKHMINHYAHEVTSGKLTIDDALIKLDKKCNLDEKDIATLKNLVREAKNNK